MRHFLTSISIVLMAFILMSCGSTSQTENVSQSQQQIVGRWQIVEIQDGSTSTIITPATADEVTYEFFADGSFTIQPREKTVGGVQRSKGTYTLRENGQLVLEATTGTSSVKMNADASIADDKLTLKVKDRNTTIFKRLP